MRFPQVNSAIALFIAFTLSFQVHGADRLESRLREIRVVEDLEQRLGLYDALVDSLGDSANTDSGHPSLRELSDADRAFLELGKQHATEAVDALSKMSALAEKMNLTFDDSEKLQLATQGQKLLRAYEDWVKSDEAARFAKEFGCHLGDDFYVVFLGRRDGDNTFVSSEVFYYGVIYLGEREWKVAKVSWHLVDLLGDTVSNGSGKLRPDDLIGQLNIVSVDSSSLLEAGSDHIVGWEDAYCARNDRPAVVWSK